MVNALVEVLSPEGMLRGMTSRFGGEGLPEQVDLVHGDVPQNIEVREGGALPRGTVDRTEDRCLPGPAGKPDARRRLLPVRRRGSIASPTTAASRST